MDIQKIHNDLLFLANKEWNFWPPTQIDAMLHRAQLWKYEEAFERYAKDQQAQDDLSVFKKKFTFTTSSTTGGVINLDSDYQHLLAVWLQQYNNTYAVTEYKPLKIVNEDELPGRLNSQLIPKATVPFATQSAFGELQLYPEVPSAGYAIYLINPIAPVLGHSIVGRTITYNVNTSTQLLWNDTCINQIIIKALQFLGVNIEAGSLLQFTEAKDQQKI